MSDDTDFRNLLADVPLDSAPGMSDRADEQVVN